MGCEAYLVLEKQHYERFIYEFVHSIAFFLWFWKADWYPDGLLHDYVWNKIKVEVDDDEDDEY